MCPGDEKAGVRLNPRPGGQTAGDHRRQRRVHQEVCTQRGGNHMKITKLGEL